MISFWISFRLRRKLKILAWSFVICHWLIEMDMSGWSSGVIVLRVAGEIHTPAGQYPGQCFRGRDGAALRDREQYQLFGGWSKSKASGALLAAGITLHP